MNKKKIILVGVTLIILLFSLLKFNLINISLNDINVINIKMYELDSQDKIKSSDLFLNNKNDIRTLVEHINNYEYIRKFPFYSQSTLSKSNINISIQYKNKQNNIDILNLTLTDNGTFIVNKQLYKALSGENDLRIFIMKFINENSKDLA